jgi:hypothetical protein
MPAYYIEQGFVSSIGKILVSLFSDQQQTSKYELIFWVECIMDISRFLEYLLCLIINTLFPSLTADN